MVMACLQALPIDGEEVRVHGGGDHRHVGDVVELGPVHTARQDRRDEPCLAVGVGGRGRRDAPPPGARLSAA